MKFTPYCLKSHKNWNYWPSTEEIFGSSSSKAKKANWGPYKPLPNCSRFSIKLNKYDELYEAFGIKKKYAPSLKWTPHTNSAMNRYFLNQLVRMKQASDVEYWKIASWLLSYSNVMLMMALRHVVPRWHRDMKLNEVLRVLKAVRKLAREDKREIEYYRVWIPKPGKSEHRPLGCPTLEWRIYLHMINQLIVYRAMIKGTIPSQQHGFVPHRGTLTAWRDLLKNTIRCRDIYEIDLRKFFDQIKILSLKDPLYKNCGISGEWYLRLIDINKSIVKPARVSGVETQQQKIDRENWTLQSNILSKADIETFTMDDLQNFGKVSSSSNEPSLICKGDVNVGVPQGAPTSPFIACQALYSLISETVYTSFDPVTGLRTERDLIGYADDWVIFGQHFDPSYLVDNAKMKAHGVTLNLDKSGWVKRDGKWLKPLKFLGLVYDGETDTLSSSTRKGASMTFDKHNLVEALKARSIANARGEKFTIPATTYYLEGGKRIARKLEHKPYPCNILDGVTYYDNYSYCSHSRDTYFKLYHWTEETFDWKYGSTTGSCLNGSWENFIASSFMGFAQSRLYIGDWVARKFIQSFDLVYIPGSWMDTVGSYWGGTLDVFNSSSFAYADLGQRLKS